MNIIAPRRRATSYLDVQQDILVFSRRLHVCRLRPAATARQAHSHADRQAHSRPEARSSSWKAPLWPNMPLGIEGEASSRAWTYVSHLVKDDIRWRTALRPGREGGSIGASLTCQVASSTLPVAILRQNAIR
jgi:hypothetical protein